MYRVFKEAGRPMPQFSSDDVIDYMVLEAVVIKARKEEEKAQKAAKINEWKKESSGLDELRKHL